MISAVSLKMSEYVTEGAQILFLPALRLAYDTCITSLAAPWQK